MLKIICISNKLFPNRYKKHSQFKASYGFVAISNGEVMLYLDARYHAKARAEKVSFKPLEDLPRLNCVIDPWEWTIAQFKRFNFVNPKFEAYEQYKECEKYGLSDNISLDSIQLIKQFLQRQKIKKYLVTNVMNLTRPTIPLMLYNDHIMPLEGEVLFDPEITPLAYLSKLGNNSENRYILDPIREQDAIIMDKKYDKFLDNDSIAWMKFWQILEQDWANLTEIDCANLLKEQQKIVHGEKFISAFEPIVGNNENAAHIHTNATNKILESGVLLVDSGSSVNKFKSDVTRVFQLGTHKHSKTKEDYTNVLKAHIEIAMLKFKKDTPVGYLDSLARKHVNFAHALGHGVGASDVHAYPTISSNSNSKLKEGMILAIEPGFYAQHYGIRLESQFRVISYDDDNFGFEYLTFIPFEKELINLFALNSDQKLWLSNFHQKCYYKLNGKIDQAFLNNKV